MDPLSTLAVRFHVNGEFLSVGRDVHWIGGSEVMSYIDRDKVSYPEIVGHLRDHMEVPDGTMLHWLFPGMELSDGLTVIWDDNSCLKMLDAITDGGVADIYVECRAVQGEGDADNEHSDYEDEIEHISESEGEVNVRKESRQEVERQVARLKEFYSSPTKKGKAVVGSDSAVVTEASQGVMTQGSQARLAAPPTSEGAPEAAAGGTEGTAPVENEEGHRESSSDSDYIPGDDCASEDDEEAAEILKKFKAFKRKVKRGEATNLDDVVLGTCSPMPAGFVGLDVEGDSEYFESDDEESCEEMGSDGEIRRKPSSLPRFKKTKDVPKFCLGMKFSSKKDFKKAIVKYALAERRVINFVKDDPKRVRAKCDWDTCPWVCLLSDTSRSESWQIVTFQDMHTCPPRMDNKMVTARRIAERYEKFIMANPSWQLLPMKQTIQEEMCATVSIPKLKRAKAMVMQKALDATKGQYLKLYQYQLELLRSNPGSTVIVHRLPDVEPPTFQRMYICLDALKKGFKAGCRKVIGLDGCFFKGATNGELLCAIGRDANNQMYPIAWAVVEVENNSSWDWFCDFLCRDLEVGDGSGWVFISDQQKGILDAVSRWAPQAEHRNCARHIYANWKKHFRNKEWQKKFWKCAKAPCLMLFNLARAKLARETRDGAQAILNTHPQHWSRAWFRLGSDCDSVDNNMCESFNKWIVEARFFPIITMLETIRRKVMVRIHDQRAKAAKWETLVCPNILKKLNVYITESAFCHAICNGASKYEVKHYEHRFTVDLEKKECSCRYWQLSGLPCPHAISCIFFKTNSLVDYISNAYSVASFKSTYEHCLMPVEGMSNWPESDRPPLKAPGYVRMPGRPKKERRREPTEASKGVKQSKVGTVIRCRKCKQIGHNRSTCDRVNGTAPSSPAASPAANSVPVAIQSRSIANDIVQFSNSQQSQAGTSTRKRKAGPSQLSSEHTKTGQMVAKSSASASTGRRGTATLQVTASIPGSQATSTVTIRNSGKASTKVTTTSPTMKKQLAKKPRPGGMMLLPPWDSAKL